MVTRSKQWIVASIAAMLLVASERTESMAAEQNTNRLINSSSPYLLQHAHNPVDWYPWGEEAFEKARRENKPILLSIGYSTCYWCHVMERGVFENPEIAKLMNDSIVSIKIDREQRPDVDEIYMTATQLITHSGGWPNNVFVTPDLKPFFAGTYFPPAAFTSMIQQIHEKYQQDRAGIRQNADQLANAIIQIKQQENKAASTTLPDQQIVDALVAHYRDYYDNRLGGFYQAPKFPNEDALLFLLDVYRLSNNSTALDMARGTLEKMAEGIFDFTLRQLTHKDGGFYSALDAETDEVEGAYYAWTDAELREALDKDSYSWLT
jgi:hypothetical protein